MNIVCPFCKGEISPVLEYTGHAYSEHRDFTGYECDEYKCGAEWNSRGIMTTPSRIEAKPMNAQVKEWCREQCIMQHATTEQDFAGMEGAWYYAISNCQAGPLAIDDITWMALLIDPIANPNGEFRMGPAVFMGGGSAADAEDIRRYLAFLMDSVYSLTPEEIYRELMWIHPFKDGNGRVGALVYNWLNGTLAEPVNAPEYK